MVDRDEETHQTILRGVGETHLAIALEKLERKFGVRVTTEDVRVRYRETITEPAEAEGRHKKQSGGHGQFAVASIRVEPLERGAGFEFVDKIVGGAISRSYIPAVRARRRGDHGPWRRERPSRRRRAGDARSTARSTASTARRWRSASPGASPSGQAMAQAGPVVLEPISRVDVTVPSDLLGDVMGDLNARRGRVQGTEPGDAGEQVVYAVVPESELLRYAIELRSLTGGRGRFRAEHDHYDVGSRPPRRGHPPRGARGRLTGWPIRPPV